MNNEIMLTGQWYIPQTQETLSGTLLIDQNKKQIVLTLTALSTNENLIAPIRAHGHHDLIQGRIDTGGCVALYDCMFGGQHNYIGQRTKVTVTAGAAFWGLEVEETEDLCFRQVSIDFGEIIEWTGLCSFEWELTDGGEDRLVWRHGKDVVFPIGEEVCLRISAQPGPRKMWSFRKEIKVTQSVCMYLEYRKEMHWEKILEDVGKLRCILTLGMSRRIFIDGMQYYHKSHRDRRRQDYIHEAPVYLGDGQEGSTSAEPGRHCWLFSLDELAEEECKCLRSWYDKYDRMKPVTELYEAAWNVPGISAEMLFLNLAQAMETYHARFISDNLRQYVEMVDGFLREQFGLQPDAELTAHEKAYRKIMINQDEDRPKRIVLKSRLGYLFLARFDIIFEYLDYRMEDFIDRMVYTRNYYTHYSPDKEKLIFTRQELPYVNGLLMAVLQYYMMKEIGIADDRIKEKVGMQLAGVMRSYQMRK